MKKFGKKSLVFGLFFVMFSILINSFFLGIIALTDWDFVKRLESLRFDNPEFDLLILGTSFTEYGIDTELLTKKGIESFNLALVGSSVKTSYIQLNEYLTKYCKSPQYVILALNSYLEPFDGDGIQPIVAFTMKGHKYGIKDIPVSKFRWAGMELLKKALNRKYRLMVVSYGQKKGNSNVPDNSIYQELYLNKNKYETAYWMGEIAKLCYQNGIELLIIEMPGIKETQNQSETGPHLLCFSNGYSSVLYNFNTQEFCKILDEDKDWSGMSHLNKIGAAKFTKELISNTPLGNSVTLHDP